MEVYPTYVLEFLRPKQQFVCPIYQRHYCWEQEHCAQLWDDIVRMQRKNDRGGHFMGSIINIGGRGTPNSLSKFEIIDGQQRLTTLTLILAALRDYAIENNSKDIDPEIIESNYLKNKDAKGNEKYKLLLTGEDKVMLSKLIDRKLNHDLQKNLSDDDEQISKLLASYKYFKKRLEEKNRELSPSEIHDALGKLKIVNITLDQDDNSQAIFESMNSSGKDLSKSDLIKNFVLMGLDHNDVTRVYKKYWAPTEKLFGNNDNNTKLMDDFFRDYLTLMNKNISNEAQVYENFKKWFDKAIAKHKVPDICSDIHKKAQYYANINFPHHVGDKDKDLKTMYMSIKDIKMEVSYPFLLKVHTDCFKQKSPRITKSNLIEIMQLCVSYVIRRWVCGLSSNSMNKIFVSLKNKIDTENYVPSIKKAFSELKDRQRFPSDDEFFQAFKAGNIYRDSRSGRCNYILGALANFESKNYFNPKNYTIEHVMPQTISDKWKLELGAGLAKCS